MRASAAIALALVLASGAVFGGEPGPPHVVSVVSQQLFQYYERGYEEEVLVQPWRIRSHEIEVESVEAEAIRALAALYGGDVDRYRSLLVDADKVKAGDSAEIDRYVSRESVKLFRRPLRLKKRVDVGPVNRVIIVFDGVGDEEQALRQIVVLSPWGSKWKVVPHFLEEGPYAVVYEHLMTEVAGE